MNANIEKAIHYYGSQQALAKVCGMSQAAVHKWLHGKSKIPAIAAKKIERDTNGSIKASEFLPEIFG